MTTSPMGDELMEDELMNEWWINETGGPISYPRSGCSGHRGCDRKARAMVSYGIEFLKEALGPPAELGDGEQPLGDRWVRLIFSCL